MVVACGTFPRDRRTAPRRLGSVAVPFLVVLSWSNGAHAEDAGSETTSPDRFVAFNSADAASSSSFGSFGIKAALTGDIDRDGPVVMGVLGTGTYRYTNSDVPGGKVQAFVGQARLLVGWQHTFGTTYLAGFVGGEGDIRLFTPDDPKESRHARALGVRAQAEVWSRPTPDTLIAAVATAGSSRADFWTRARFGYRVWEQVFVGPEATALGDQTYQQGRLGAHVTGLVLFGQTFDLAAGGLLASDRKRGFYGTFGVHKRF